MYADDAQGRMTAMTNGTTYSTAGQRVAARVYNAYRGLLEKKVYPGETDMRGQI